MHLIYFEQNPLRLGVRAFADCRQGVAEQRPCMWGGWNMRTSSQHTKSSPQRAQSFDAADADAGESAPGRTDILHMTAEVVSAYVGNNRLEKADISGVIGQVYGKLSTLSRQPPRTPSRTLKPRPAVPVADSVQPDYLICLEDGRKLKMLKRHLRTAFNLTPEQYRAKWGLPPDYPMVAPNYASQRSEFAKQIGLGKTTGRGGRASGR
jgi:predicted transcriptional regulator